ncbi:MAG: FIST C-terminal domain-containing protein [Saccharospirillum sp.]|nr:FIST C-terminal domain-containing protein [Saccharospirillum sp.]
MPAASPIHCAFSANEDEWQAADDLASQLTQPDIGFVLFFCSAEYNLDRLAEALRHGFPNVELAGCTTAGELTTQGYRQHSISAIGFSRVSFTVGTSLIEALDNYPLPQAQQDLDQLILDAKAQSNLATEGDFFALTLIDGLSSEEEQVLLTLDAALGRIPHFGGSAGDDIHLANTHVYTQGAFHSSAAIVVLFHTALPFEVFTTHHMQPLAQKLVVTQADPATRTVFELDAEPAAEAYARLVGQPVVELTPKHFALHPLAVKLGNDYYVRSIQRVNDDLSLTFYCAVGNGIVLTPMTPQPILPDLQQRFADIEQRIGTPLVTIGCDCFLRRLETEHLDALDDASKFLMEHRVIGFNTYGEHFGGVHLNQTFTGVVIGAGDDQPQ